MSNLFAAFVLEQLTAAGVDAEAEGARKALAPQPAAGEAVTCSGPRGHRNACGAALAHPLGQTSAHQQKAQLPTLFAVKTTLEKTFQQFLAKQNNSFDANS